MAAVTAKTSVEWNGCDEGNGVVDNNGDNRGARARVAATAAVKVEGLQQQQQRKRQQQLWGRQ